MCFVNIYSIYVFIVNILKIRLSKNNKIYFKKIMFFFFDEFYLNGGG